MTRPSCTASRYPATHPGSERPTPALPPDLRVNAGASLRSAAGSCFLGGVGAAWREGPLGSKPLGRGRRMSGWGQGPPPGQPPGRPTIEPAWMTAQRRDGGGGGGGQPSPTDSADRLLGSMQPGAPPPPGGVTPPSTIQVGEPPMSPFAFLSEICKANNWKTNWQLFSGPPGPQGQQMFLVRGSAPPCCSALPSAPCCAACGGSLHTRLRLG